MSDLSPLSGEERKLDFGAVRSVGDPERTLSAKKYFIRPVATSSAVEFRRL